VSQQDGFSDDGTDSTGSTKPNDGDDRMKKKSQNVEHDGDGIRVKMLKNSERAEFATHTG
jgi:hypothetical protein